MSEDVTSKRRTRLGALLVVIVSLAACVAGILNGFSHDDIAIIVEDDRLHDTSQWGTVLRSPYWPPPAVADQYRPVASILLSLQFLIGGGASLVYRVVSYVLYAGAALALYGLGRRVLPFGAALGAALLFAAHPVHVEATALGVNQNEILVAILCLLATALYLARRRSEDTTIRDRDWLTLNVMFLVAAFTKEQGFLLPAFLLLAELTLTRSAVEGRWRSLMPGYTLVASALVILAVRVAVLGEQSAKPAVAEALIGAGLPQRIATFLQLVPEYLRLLAWPAHLRIDYSPREFVAAAGVGARELFGLGILVALCALAWAARRRAPVVTFGLAWMAVALLPVSNVVIPTGVLIAERTLFVPSVGFVLAVAGAAAFATERWRLVERVWLRRAATVVVALLVVLGVARSAARQRVWRSDATLTLSAMRDSPRSWRAHAQYGELLFDEGKPDAGAEELYTAIQLAPNSTWARNALARRLRSVGKDKEAVEQLHQSLRQTPGQVDAVAELIAAMLALGRYAEASTIVTRILGGQQHDLPPLLLSLRRLADSAAAVNAPPGSVRITIPPQRRGGQ